MPLKLTTTRLREFSHIKAITYRIPLLVTERQIFASGDSYPVCPRCACTIEREYMYFCDRCGQKLAWCFSGTPNV